MTRPYQLLTTATPETFLVELLQTRGIVTALEQAAFLEPDYQSLHDPYLLSDMVQAVERIKLAIANFETIAIFSDYDCDGIPGAVVLYDFFTAAGYQQFFNVIPHRHYEGFGLSVEAVQNIAKQQATLIITIDCGTASHEAIALAKELGIDVIVTDHHEPTESLPSAVAIINPKLGGYPFPHLCGAGVVFKLVQALLATGTFPLIKPGQEKWWLDMVGIATIADMVPLIGENRILAHFGLRVLRQSRRPGLQQLLRKNKLSQAHLTEEDIGFTIGPRINAASRMDAPEHAFFMLTTKDEAEAGAYVERLEKLNTERKSTVAQMTKEINHRLTELESLPPVLVLGNPLWRPALVGLAANKLAETYQRPVFLWGRDGNNVIKGSCRSGGQVSVVKIMEAAADTFIEFGGHHASGGFSVHDENVFTLADTLIDTFIKLGHEAEVSAEVIVQAELSLDDVFGRIRQDLKNLAPFGTGHERPLFAFINVVPTAVEIFGKNKEHLKLIFKTDHGPLEAIAFFATSDSFTMVPGVDRTCTLLAHIEESFFMGRRLNRLRIVDIV